MSFLELRNIIACYNENIILNNISISIDKGDFIAFLGPSGSGKTTLLYTIAGLLLPDSGEIFLNNINITDTPPEKRGCGMVFQGYALFPNLTVEQNVSYGLYGRPKKDCLKIVGEMLNLVGLSEMSKRYPSQLSGGQQQRVALARALAPTPRLLLLDEPLAALDAKIRTQLAEELRHLQKRLGITTIMVTHDQKEALSMADSIFIINKGIIEQVGPPKEIYTAPSSHFVASFIGSMNFFNVKNINYGIRYEDVIVNEATELRLKRENTFIARIVCIRYLGSFTRLELEIQSDIFNENVYADVPTADCSNFAVNTPVAVELPYSRWCFV